MLVVYFFGMAPANHVHEIEIKLQVPNLGALRRTLKRLRARVISLRIHESNALYDTPDEDLRRRGQLIRIRTEQPAANSRMKRPKTKNGGNAAILTYKGPIASPRKGTPWADLRARFKVREEAEVAVTGSGELDRILHALGLRPMFRYEKFRTTYALPRLKGVKIEVDETPMGNYLELEGSPSGIDRAASVLGYTPSDYIKATYGALYLADCRRRGRKPGDMLFPK